MQWHSTRTVLQKASNSYVVQLADGLEFGRAIEDIKEVIEWLKANGTQKVCPSHSVLPHMQTFVRSGCRDASAFLWLLWHFTAACTCDIWCERVSVLEQQLQR